jgi:hypothetical protein
MIDRMFDRYTHSIDRVGAIYTLLPHTSSTSSSAKVQRYTLPLPYIASFAVINHRNIPHHGRLSSCDIACTLYQILYVMYVQCYMLYVMCYNNS